MSRAGAAEQNFQLGRTAYAAKRWDEASRHFGNAIALGMNTIQVHDCRVASMSRIKGWEKHALEAAHSLVERFKNDKRSWIAHLRLAEVLRLQHDFIGAYQSLETASVATGRLLSQEKTKALGNIAAKKAQARQEHMAASKARREAITLSVEEERQRKEKEMRARRVRLRMATGVNNQMLPHDVIAAICANLLEHNPNAPVIIGSVCKSWRSAVVESFWLWSKLVIAEKRPKAKADLWLRRSRNRLLTLIVGETFRAAGKEDETLASLLPILGEVRHLSDFSPFWSRATWLHQFKSLESLTINSGNGPEPLTLSSFDARLLHPNCTSLRRLSLSKAILGPQLVSIPAQLTNLRSLQVVQLSGSFLPLLEATPRLEELVVASCKFGDERRPPSSIYLEHLRVYEDWSYLSAPAIYWLETPILQELSTYKCRVSPPTVLASSDHDEALANVKSLDFGHAPLGDDAIIAFARRTPSLQFLNVCYTAITDKFIEALAHRDGLDDEDQLLPNLIALSVAGTEVTAGAIRDMVNSRLLKEERIAVYTGPKKVIAKSSNAFKPSAPAKAASVFKPASRVSGASGKDNESPAPAPSTPAQPPLGPSSSIAELGPEVFATQPDNPHRVRPRIQWLCLDKCERVDPAVIPMLESKVAFVSCSMQPLVEDRIRGKGKYRCGGLVDPFEGSVGRAGQKTF